MVDTASGPDQAISSALARWECFSQFHPGQLDAIASRFCLQTKAMGEPLLIADAIPSTLYLLLSGQLRQLVNHASQPGRSLTLALYEPPFIAGWASLQAAHPLEFLTAASECTLLAIPASDWLNLLSQHPPLSLHYRQQFSPADLWPLLQAQPDLTLPTSSKELRSWIRRLASLAQVQLITPDSASQIALDAQHCWLLASGGQTIPLGTRITAEQLPDLQTQAEGLIRLIGLPANLWTHPQSASLLAPSLSTPRPSAVSASVPSVEDPSPGPDDQHPNQVFRFYSSAPGPIPEAVACFKMLASHLNLPLKADLLQRILEDQSSRSGGTVSLQLCAALAESLGLQTQLLNLPVGLIGRLQIPALIHLGDGELTVAFAASPSGLLLGRPRSSMESVDAETLMVLASEDGTLPILLLRVTDRTPQKRFGLSWFLPAIRRHRRQLIEVLVASLFVQLFQLMNPLIVQQIVDKVIGQNGMSTLPVLAVLLVCFSIFENVLTAVRTNLFIETTNRIDLSLGEQVIDHLLRLPLGYFDRRPVGELSSRLAELEQIRSFLTGTALTVVLDVVFSVIYIIVMLIYSWVLTIVALLVAPLLALITVGTSPVIRQQLRTKAELNAKTQNHLVEVLSGIQTVKAQNFELMARWRWKERYAGYVAESFRNAVTSTTTNGFTQFLNQASTLSVLCVGAYLVLQGQLTLGQLIAFRIIAGYVTGPLLRLSNLYQNFQQTALSLERLADIVDTPQESNEADRVNIPLPPITGAITYDTVSFRFGQEGPLQLSQVSLDIPAGEFVAIVGQSGSGKSTLTKLLPRLYPPLSGRILVDQYDIAKVELYSLRRQIGIVPQDSLLFEGSVQDNIALTNPEATSEEIIAASRVACAHDFIMELPAGYSSPVGERGGGLSGGQRQRIAIARTVLQNPRLLIMDEATSALDYDTERRVSLNLMEHFRGRTVLFITHRLSSIKHADRILLMHQGQLEEQGTHDELMAARGRYYALFRQQEAGSST
ncbi:peptidase domain-containing ABC transporter [Synechococcus sp. HJ21-Hayes]|uniref:peptidase domain-containing ABC transporter n=1 Tax=Synechococcus sp. HJ21-Hayes TaxID=2823736 RepID=UPI0020CF0803|nr:peptidase domain-containing ABC transporter [Synechococcus sp. HJ21-Hayes]MCP9854171.1 peptidase domain-containing ABC transporter [Synechococcus sp. HJ21-Hayes]